MQDSACPLLIGTTGREVRNRFRLALTVFRQRSDERSARMSDAIRRIERWQKKYSPERTKATLELLQDEMRQRYAAVTTEMTAMELQVKEVLNQQGVHTTNYVPY